MHAHGTVVLPSSAQGVDQRQVDGSVLRAFGAKLSSFLNGFSMIRCSLALVLLTGACWLPGMVPAAGQVDFESDIAPILSQHCVRCHYEGHSQGDVSLQTLDDLRDGGYLSHRDPDSSYLLELVTGSDNQPPSMPQDGPPLASEQVELLRKWIVNGAPWPKNFVVQPASQADRTWWSLQPLQPTIPVRMKQRIKSGAPGGSQSGEQVRDERVIDAFVRRKLAEQGLDMNPPSDRRTLIRRVTYDLTGLPPTPQEIESFLRDPSPTAYETVVDRLLASPAYGERWGRHWLDVVRFGESTGYERNLIVDDAWPFRDYVIRAFNEDRRFDQVIREHIAGDVIAPENPQTVIGSAFLVNGPHDIVNNQDAAQAAQIRADTVDEMVRATSEAFLGLTVGCARCHDHKFDPISQADYYRLAASFAGVRHGSSQLATSGQKKARNAKIKPLLERRRNLTRQRDALQKQLAGRAEENQTELVKRWTRSSVDRQGTEERFAPIRARHVRLVCTGRDNRIGVGIGFQLDELEVWSAGERSENLALASRGGSASGKSREIEDFPGAYGAQLVIDGQFGRRFIAAANSVMVTLAEPSLIDRVTFSCARQESKPDQAKFTFVADYRIEVSMDGQRWIEVADSRQRLPVSDAHRQHLLKQMVTSSDERKQLGNWDRQIRALTKQLESMDPLPTAWIGSRSDALAKGPFAVLVGGSPQRLGQPVWPGSLSTLERVVPGYEVRDLSQESGRRLALADWLVHADNPLTPRVLANRIWHYHFGNGIVSTPSDFGWMGAAPSHPELLDWLAGWLLDHHWRLKPMHRMIVLTNTYRQSSDFRQSAADLDADARWLWRFPPRRLMAEEIRDTMLAVSGQLDRRRGGAGFRLYRYLQDNVATYVPLDRHGPETYRRAVYHQNARACRTDLITDFDQPDCAFSTAKRAQTTTPLQALTALNHSFTMDMATAMADRLEGPSRSLPEQIGLAFELCFGRPATPSELAKCRGFVAQTSLADLCRVLLNTSELTHIR